MSLPLLSDGPDWLGSLESTGWFLLADLAGILRGLTQLHLEFDLVEGDAS